MRRFRDNTGRAWDIEVNCNTIRRVRDVLKVDLVSLEPGTEWYAKLADVVTLCNVLFVLVETQAKADGISDKDFGRALTGDAIDGATDALTEEIVSFFPSRQRQVLSLALATARAEAAKLNKILLKSARSSRASSVFSRARSLFGRLMPWRKQE